MVRDIVTPNNSRVARLDRIQHHLSEHTHTFKSLYSHEKKERIDLGVARPPGRAKLPRKEVIQPHLPVRLPCYDFTPITDPTLDACLSQGVSLAASGVADFRGVTGGVYKTRERIHRGVLTHGY